MQNSVTRTDLESSTLQLIVDQVEELIATMIEEIRERPGVAVAILAAIVGAGMGSMIARRRNRRPSMRRMPGGTRTLFDAAELVGLTFKLLQNPIVRAYLASMLAHQLKRRVSP